MHLVDHLHAFSQSFVMVLMRSAHSTEIGKLNVNAIMQAICDMKWVVSKTQNRLSRRKFEVLQCTGFFVWIKVSWLKRLSAADAEFC